MRRDLSAEGIEMTATLTAPTFAGKTEAEYLALARDCSARSAESFARCDTDGYLSQWASDVSASKYRFMAALAAADGMWEFRALADLEGNVLPARNVQTKYGAAWVYDTEFKPVWFNESKAKDPKVRKANNAKKGFTFVRVLAPAKYRMTDGLTPMAYAVPAVPLTDPQVKVLGPEED